MEVNPNRLETAIHTVVERCDPDQIILFGSGARGEMNADSDIDLLVIKKRSGEDPTTWQEHWKCGTDDRLDVIIMDRETAERYRHSAYYVQGSALEEGRSIYTRDGFTPIRTGPTYTWNGSAMVKTTKFEPDHATVLLENAQRWWGYAEGAQHPPDKCQMGHEAIEQALKGLIVASGRRVEHIHEVNELWEQAERGTDRIGAVRDPAIMKRLTQHSGTWRYNMKDENPSETWEKSKDTIKDVLNDARRRIPGMIEQTRTELRSARDQGNLQAMSGDENDGKDDPRAKTRRAMAAHADKMTTGPKIPGIRLAGPGKKPSTDL